VFAFLDSRSQSAATFGEKRSKKKTANTATAAACYPFSHSLLIDRTVNAVWRQQTFIHGFCLAREKFDVIAILILKFVRN